MTRGRFLLVTWGVLCLASSDDSRCCCCFVVLMLAVLLLLLLLLVLLCAAGLDEGCVADQHTWRYAGEAPGQSGRKVMPTP